MKIHYASAGVTNAGHVRQAVFVIRCGPGINRLLARYYCPKSVNTLSESRAAERSNKNTAVRCEQMFVGRWLQECGGELQLVRHIGNVDCWNQIPPSLHINSQSQIRVLLNLIKPGTRRKITEQILKNEC